MSALEAAARAVEHARVALLRELRNPTEWVSGEHGCDDREAEHLVRTLVSAVRAHDAEIVRADIGHIRYGSATEYAIRHAALIDPDSPMSKTKAEWAPEVEVRFGDGQAARIAGFSVTTEAATGLVAVEGFVASSAGQLPRGDAVRLAYLGIPSRGALADITASVELFTRLDVLHIRIRTTIPREVTP